MPRYLLVFSVRSYIRTVFCIGYEVVSMTQRHDDDKLRHWLAAAAVVD